MSLLNLLGRGKDNGSLARHTYQDIDIDGNARAHLGDTYHFGLDNPLHRLPCAVEASFNSYHRQHEPTCLPRTRVDVLQEIYNWADGQDERCIFWLNGLAGTGKSTIARTVARRYFEQKRLGASFFFSKGGGDVGHAGKFFTSFAVQLAHNTPQLQQYISEAVTEQSDIANQSLRDQWRHLVLRPLSRLDGSSSPSSYVLIIDALDECDSEDDVRIILQLLAEARTMKTIRLRFFLTSRPDIPIRHGMYHISQAEHQDFVLHNISPAVINHDISLFLEYNLRIIGQEWTLGADWPGEQALRQLVVNASGLFIWAATACRFIRDGRDFAERRLFLILQSGESVTAPERHLNEIYTTVLKSSISLSYDNFEREDILARFRKVLGSMVTLFSPLSASSISRLLYVTKEWVNRTLNHLHAILDIPEDQARPLRLHHPSFRDFILDKDRCIDLKFWVDEKKAHRTLAEGCIQLMWTSLNQDICEQDAPGVLVADIESSRVERYLPPEIQYACLYWIQHLQKSGAQLSDNDQVHQFLKKHFLHWLEALSWMQKVSIGIYAITSLESIALTSDCPNLYDFIHDMKRFALYSRQVIEQAPLQVYCSALVFAPEMSIVRKQFKDRVPQWIQRLPKVEEDWNALIQTLEGHSGSVNSVAFSPDGRQLASASWDHTIRLWDAATGAALQTLEGHRDSVNSVTFSPDGRQLASASYDHTIRLWDAATGAALQTLEGHSGWVNSVAFSPDGRQLALASGDQTIRLWDAATGAALQTLEGHSGWVYSVTFSPDGRQLASASYDHTIRLWDAATGAALQTLEGHRDSVNSVTFSPDGRQLASASGDHTIRLWDAATGAALQTLEGHSGWVYSVTFSPDGRQLVSASDDHTIRLWDAATGAALQTLEGHRDSVKSVTFSPDGRQLASASGDRTIRLWDAATGAVLQTLEGHRGLVNSVAFSPDGRQLASASGDQTIQLWDAATGTVLQTLEGHRGLVNSVAFSPDGRQLASASEDHTIQLWDTATGAALQTLEGLRDMHMLSLSIDGFYLQTNRGSSQLQFIAANKLPQSATLSNLLLRDEWITREEARLLWLPHGYRSAAVAVSGDTIAIGQKSGRISILEFSVQ